MRKAFDDKESVPEELREAVAGSQEIPNIGPAMARDLVRISVLRLEDLIGEDPDALYGELCVVDGTRHDPRVRDVFAAAVAYANGEPAVVDLHARKKGPRERREAGAMRFGYTILYIKDVHEAVSFYEEAFGLARRFVHESGQYAEMETGETTLAFASLELAESNLPSGFRRNDPAELPAGIEVAFITSDVEAAFGAAMRAGATKVAEPDAKPWGQTVSYVRDPDGVLIELANETR